MAKKPLGNILLCVLLQAASHHHPVNSSLEVVVEGDRMEIECTMNSLYGVDWRFNNGTNNYDLSNEGVVPDIGQFRMDYSLKTTNNSLHNISCLTVRQVKKSSVGTYICKNGENGQQILSSVDLALLTIPKCESDTSSTGAERRYVCNFTSFGNISSRLEWIEDFCTNSTPTVCMDENEGKTLCEFPINRKNRTFLPFMTNLNFQSTEACKIICKSWDGTSTDAFLTTSLKVSIQISVLLQCSVNPNITVTNRPTNMITNTTPPRSPGETGSDFYLIASIVVSITGVLLTLIIIAIFRNTDACSCGRESPNKHNIEERFGEEFDDNSHFYHEAGSGVQTGGGPIYHVLEPSFNGTTPGHPAIALSNTHEKDTDVGNPVYADPDEIRPAPIYEEIPNV